MSRNQGIWLPRSTPITKMGAEARRGRLRLAPAFNEDPRRTPMREYLKFYIDGEWVDPAQLKTLDVENPATEEVAGKIALGSAADVDKAVKAAKTAFPSWSQTSREE